MEVTDLKGMWLDIRVAVAVPFSSQPRVLLRTFPTRTLIPVIRRQTPKKCIRKAWISHIACLVELAMSFIWIFDGTLSSFLPADEKPDWEDELLFYHLSSDEPSSRRERKQSIKMFPDSIWVEPNAQCRLQFPLLLFVLAGRHMMLCSCNGLFRGWC